MDSLGGQLDIWNGYIPNYLPIADGYVIGGDYIAFMPDSFIAKYKDIFLGYYSAQIPDSLQQISAFDVSPTGHASFGIAANAINNELLATTFWNNAGLKHWWADVFLYGHVDNVQGWIDGPPTTPEELSACCNTAMAFGASGFWFFTNDLRLDGNESWIDFTER